MCIGRDVYEIQKARFDLAGVGFEEDRIDGRAAWRGDLKVHPRPLTPPIAWDRIDAIKVKHTHHVAGAIVGAILFEVVTLSIFSRPGFDDGGGVGVLPASVAVGALVGSIAGGGVFCSWPDVWQKPAGPSPAAP